MEIGLFGDLDNLTTWKKEWQGMPEFIQEDLMPWKTIEIYFENQADVDSFSRLVGCKLTDITHYIWFPEATKEIVADKRWADETEGSETVQSA